MTSQTKSRIGYLMPT